jgi:GNAT superfamily N-acetyltransferase
MIIRRALSSDALMLTQLMHECSAYRGEYAAILQGYVLAPEQLASDEIYLLEEATTILGFYSLTNIATCPELDLMFVANESQGKKIGAMLFGHMREKAASLGVREVKIVAHPPAEAFYVRMGARPAGVKAPSGRVTWARPILLVTVSLD